MINLLISVGGKEWIFILLAIIVLFGAKKIPELMKGMGTGIKEFKNAVKEQDSQPKDESQDS